jgi:hypothetical protein
MLEWIQLESLTTGLVVSPILVRTAKFVYGTLTFFAAFFILIKTMRDHFRGRSLIYKAAVTLVVSSLIYLVYKLVLIGFDLQFS